jgi:hypothetical protein
MITHKAGYHLYGIEVDGSGFRLTAHLRGLMPNGSIGDHGTLMVQR